MKPEEIEKAIRGLKNIVEFWCYRPEEIEIAKLAIAALEKQVAKKLRIEPIGNVCPECFYDTAFMSKGEEYCPNCGQKINWEETP